MSRPATIAPIASLLLLAGLLVACSSGPARPVLYPNATLNEVGRQQADADIAACEAMANDAGTAEGGQGGAIAKRAGVGAAVGAATGAVIGAIVGDFGKGVAIGAATGGASGATSGAYDDDAGVNRTYRAFVTRCLSERGYEVVGFE